MTTATSKGFDIRQIAHTNMYKSTRPRTALASKVVSQQRRPKTPKATTSDIALTQETLQKFKDENNQLKLAIQQMKDVRLKSKKATETPKTPKFDTRPYFTNPTE